MMNGCRSKKITSRKLIDRRLIGNWQGGPCINSVAADIFGNPQQCNEVSSINNGNSFTPQTGNIKLIKHDNGKYGLLVGGFAGPDSILAAQILAHRSNELNGMEVIVTSPDGSWQNAEITIVN